MENRVLKSIDKYFQSLTATGYRKQKDVDSLLVLLFINKFLTQGTSNFITDKDYQTIDRALYCLYGSNCLIPFPRYVNYRNTLQAKYDNSIHRGTEDSVLRFTEDGSVRFKDIY